MTESAALIADLAAERHAAGHAPHVLGLCGPQGSGKSTAAEAAVHLLGERGLRAAVLSLDDLYLDRAARAALAAEIHPLFATRGPPGTHDVEEGERILAALKCGETVRFPRFDKIADDRRAEPGPPVGPLDVLIFEGWCIGAAPQDETELAAPVNALEAQCDPDAIWRRTVNHHLASDYRRLFAALDSLVLIRAPAFEIVFRWRLEQEETNRGRHDANLGGRPMDADAIERFIRHYERLTRHIDAEMLVRADLVIQLDAERRPITARRAG